jgi:hypothetical protein
MVEKASVVLIESICEDTIENRKKIRDMASKSEQIRWLETEVGEISKGLRTTAFASMPPFPAVEDEDEGEDNDY